MRRTGLSEQEAYRILQRTSQDRSVPMVDVAREVLESEPGR
jgi:response regulator NasT